MVMDIEIEIRRNRLKYLAIDNFRFLYSASFRNNNRIF